MSIPTFVAIKDGEVLGTSIGVQDEEEILKCLINKKIKIRFQCEI